MQVVLKYDEHYFCHFIVFLLFYSHMVRRRGTKCLMVVHFTLLIILQPLKYSERKKEFESTVFIVQYSVSCSPFSY